MLIKQGVDISRLRREARQILAIAQKCWPDEIVVTSTYEGNHDPSSCHYVNDAIDFRLPRVAGTYFEMLAKCVQADLGDHYFVKVEGECIHIQYNRAG